MPNEIIPIAIAVTFFFVWGMIGEIVVRGR